MLLGVSASGEFRRGKVSISQNHLCVHQTLRVTPAMEAGITDHVWFIEEIVWLLN